MNSSPSDNSSQLTRSVEDLKEVGPARAKELHRLGVNSLGDLLEYFPRNYQFESAERNISELVADQIQLARGEIVAVNYTPGTRSRFEATIEDNTGKLALAWFNAAYLRRTL